MICHDLLVICILVSATVLGDATAAYKPTDLFLINCGTTSDTIDAQSQTWTSDQRELLTSKLGNVSFSSDASYQQEVLQVPYMTARIFLSTANYSFPVSPGLKYIRLYFYPTRYESGFDAASSFFSVTVNGFTLLNNFSADVTAKASNEAFIIKEFIVPVSSGHPKLNLTFTPSPNSLAFVNGIEIVSMPDRFYSKGGFDNMITQVGRDFDFEIDNSTAFETVYRVNIAGKMIDAVSDTGMFRRWLADEFLLSENSGLAIYVPGVKINYTEQTPAYVAQEDVYTTFHTMGNLDNPRLNLNFNLTWLFPVDAGFLYLVRLHFCLPEVDAPGQRVFTIFIGNQIAMLEVDVIQLSGGSRIPVYLDFILLVGFESGPRPDLRLDLHPFKDIAPMCYDAILNGVEILKLNGSDGDLSGPNPNPLLPSDGNHVKPSIRKGTSHVLVITLFAVFGSSIVLAMLVAFIVLLCKKKKTKDVPVRKPTDSCSPLTTTVSSLPSYLCRRFSISEIKYATNDFDEKLIVGSGGFGSVYKGRIDGGATLVAVKRLGVSSKQGAKEFETELEMLSKLRHRHLVSLIGYCDEENEMVLVYEYMPRGTLKDHLYKRNKAIDPPLSWTRRLEICIGAARGLQYLHSGAKHPIIHRDIKTTNILLDENYAAKVSDFGISKVGPTSASQTHVSTVVKGTLGYLDPEYYRRQVLTVKSDVYSFGVVLFEVLCCRLIDIQNIPQKQSDLIRWVKSNYIGGTLDQIIDPELAVDITLISLEKFCEIAVRCVQDRGIERPPMNDVVLALEFALQLHETAKKNNEWTMTDAEYLFSETNNKCALVVGEEPKA